jgi:D-glycero-alpha-D-manno-heptose-7-phosphate kinase
LKQQSGIQDQICAVNGGINFIKMIEYPFNVDLENLNDSLDIHFVKELERRLVLVFLGNSHLSSQVHDQVIKECERSDDDKLVALRKTARISIEAIKSHNFELLGKAMIENNEAQRKLHPDLISKDADQCIEIAKQFGVLGYKVNGAGGVGGTITILTDYDQPKKRKMIDELEKHFREIPIQLDLRGLTVWESK